MPIRKVPNAEPIPGYRLVELLGKGGCGEVWKCRAPGGLYKAIKFVYGDEHDPGNGQDAAGEELRAIERIKEIRHPFLLGIDRIEHIHNELVIVTELAGRNLHELLIEYQHRGQAGLPRTQVLGYLREAAEVLDLLHQEFGLQHLDVKPRNLFVVYNHVKVGDFGLVNSLRSGDSADKSLEIGAITPLYASPELLRGGISPHCDQYSLAISFQELLTGTMPFEGENSRQLFLAHTANQPNLDTLPAGDRAIVAKALAKTPNERYRNCMELIRLLSNASPCSDSVAGVFQKDGPTDQSEVRCADESLPGAGAGCMPSVNSEADTDGKPARTARRTVQTIAQQRRPVFIGGYRLLELLESTPLVETWQVEDEQGRKRLLRFLFGATPRGDELEQILERLRNLRHPILNQLQVEEHMPGRIAVVSDLNRRSLRDELREYRETELGGIPRLELLDLLRPVAEGLDYLFLQNAIQHLNLHPRNLLLENGRLVVDGFGLFQLLWASSTSLLQLRNRRYSAPELAENKISPRCDQYNLALVYVEMLTGVLPQRRSPGAAARMNLDALPPGDRKAVARALSADPTQRWAGCSDFLAALDNDYHKESRFTLFEIEQFTDVIESKRALHSHQLSAEDVADSTEALTEIVSKLAGGMTDAESPEEEQRPQITEDGQHLQYKFIAGLPLGEARLKLAVLRHQLFGDKLEDNGEHFVFHINAPKNFLQKWIGQQPGLRVTVALSRQRPSLPTPIEVIVEVKPCGCGKERGRQLIDEMGLDVLSHIRAALLVNSEKRIQARPLWPHPLTIYPVFENGATGEAISCRGKDISMSGIGFYLDHLPETSEVLIDLPETETTPAASIPASLVRVNPCADDTFEVGALFLLTAVRKQPKHAIVYAQG